MKQKVLKVCIVQPLMGGCELEDCLCACVFSNVLLQCVYNNVRIGYTMRPLIGQLSTVLPDCSV